MAPQGMAPQGQMPPPIPSAPAMKKGGKVKKMASGGSVSASRRGDGIASKGKTKGRYL